MVVLSEESRDITREIFWKIVFECGGDYWGWGFRCTFLVVGVGNFLEEGFGCV